MSDKPKKIRLLDVAKEAKVSAATVSRLIRDRADVNPETRQRILEAAKRLGYNLEAAKKSRIVAFLPSNRGVLHPFHSSVLTGAENYCAEHDYGLLFLPMKYSMEAAVSELDIPEILRNRQILAGVIIAGTNSEKLPEFFTQCRIPWVALGNNIVGNNPQYQSGMIYFDDLGGAYELTQYLQSLGHKHIGFVGNRRFPWFARRYQAYLKAMQEAGLPGRSSSLNTSEVEDGGYLATKMMLKETPAVTAIFAGDDSLAGGVYKALRDLGLHIPDDVSVAGFNDTLEASFLHPPLTSVRVFTDELGRQLAESLLKNIADPDRPVDSLVIPTQLVRRESCGSVATVD